MRCHLNFYTKLKSAVPQENLDATLEELVLNAPVLDHRPGISTDDESCSQTFVADSSPRNNDTRIGANERKKSAPMRRSSSKGPSAKRKPTEKSTNIGDVNKLDSSTDVADRNRTELSAS